MEAQHLAARLGEGIVAGDARTFRRRRGGRRRPGEGRPHRREGPFQLGAPCSRQAIDPVEGAGDWFEVRHRSSHQLDLELDEAIDRGPIPLDLHRVEADLHRRRRVTEPPLAPELQQADGLNELRITRQLDDQRPRIRRRPAAYVEDGWDGGLQLVANVKSRVGRLKRLDREQGVLGRLTKTRGVPCRRKGTRRRIEVAVVMTHHVDRSEGRQGPKVLRTQESLSNALVLELVLELALDVAVDAHAKFGPPPPAARDLRPAVSRRAADRSTDAAGLRMQDRHAHLVPMKQVVPARWGHGDDWSVDGMLPPICSTEGGETTSWASCRSWTTRGVGFEAGRPLARWRLRLQPSNRGSSSDASSCR